MALIEDVATNAVQAGFGDPRFAPLSEEELDGLELDVSILSHPRPIPAESEAELVAALEPDRDGLILGRRPPARAVPAERLAAGRGRARIRAPSSAQGRARSDDLPDGPRGASLSGGGVRRAVPAGERGGNRAGADRGGGGLTGA